MITTQGRGKMPISGTSPIWLLLWALALTSLSMLVLSLSCGRLQTLPHQQGRQQGIQRMGRREGVWIPLLSLRLRGGSGEMQTTKEVDEVREETDPFGHVLVIRCGLALDWSSSIFTATETHARTHLHAHACVHTCTHFFQVSTQ